MRQLQRVLQLEMTFYRESAQFKRAHFALRLVEERQTNNTLLLLHQHHPVCSSSSSHATPYTTHNLRRRRRSVSFVYALCAIIVLHQQVAQLRFTANTQAPPLRRRLLPWIRMQQRAFRMAQLEISVPPCGKCELNWIIISWSIVPRTTQTGEQQRKNLIEWLWRLFCLT
jgi:hypothetical protein